MLTNLINAIIDLNVVTVTLVTMIVLVVKVAPLFAVDYSRR